MRDRINVHKSEARYRRAIEALRLEKRITEHDRRLILKFVRDLQSEGISELRTSKYLHLLRQLLLAKLKKLISVNALPTVELTRLET